MTNYFPQRAQAEAVRYQGRKARAEILLLQIAEGWITACAYDHQQGSMQGMGSPLTDDQVFPSRAAALAAAAERISYGQGSVLRDPGSCVTENQKTEAGKIMAWATSLLTHPAPVEPSPRVGQLEMAFT